MRKRKVNLMQNLLDSIVVDATMTAQNKQITKELKTVRNAVAHALVSMAAASQEPDWDAVKAQFLVTQKERSASVSTSRLKLAYFTSVEHLTQAEILAGAGAGWRKLIALGQPAKQPTLRTRILQLAGEIGLEEALRALQDVATLASIMNKRSQEKAMRDLKALSSEVHEGLEKRHQLTKVRRLAVA